jgi:hypothetical protein
MNLLVDVEITVTLVSFKFASQSRHTDFRETD